MWILPEVMNKIMDYLSKESKIKRVLVLVHKDTSGAAGFYKRLGFKEIEKATILDVLLRKLRINS
jgi:ribosomal protein S18 acetylase RimI-like enzyme